MSGWNSRGFEIGNALDRRAYPAARRGRTGPPPSGQQVGVDPFAARGAPIRSRPFAFGIRATSDRSLLALRSYVGPGLIKSLDLAVLTMGNNNPQPHFSIWYDTTSYITATGIALATLPHGTAVWETGSADNQPAAMAQEGGLATSGVNAGTGRYLLDFYVPEPNFFVALAVRNPMAQAASVYGSLLIYEGVLASDFPDILG